jgi:hypothetical protein
MLIRFKAKNFLSFGEATEFNMVPAELNEHPVHVYTNEVFNVLKSAIVYADPETGLASFMYSFDFLHQIMTGGSIPKQEPDEAIVISHGAIEPTSFEVEYLHDFYKYTYHISFKGNIIVDEWLISEFPIELDDLLFHRTMNANQQVEITLGRSYTQEQPPIQIHPKDYPEPNVPLICTTEGRKIIDIEFAYDWFTRELTPLTPIRRYEGITLCYMGDPDFRVLLKHWIAKFNIGIIDFELVTVNLEEHEAYLQYNKKERSQLLKILQSGEVVRLLETANGMAMLEEGILVLKELKSCRVNLLGEKVSIDFQYEPFENLCLINLVLALHFMKRDNRTVIVDDTLFNIDPVLIKELITTFEKEHDGYGQLIWTTDQADMLDEEMFGKDQLWRARRDNKGDTHLDQMSTK